jgi:plastocyanin
MTTKLPLKGIISTIDSDHGYSGVYAIKTVSGTKWFYTTKELDIKVGDTVELVWYSNLYMDAIESISKTKSEVMERFEVFMK